MAERVDLLPKYESPFVPFSETSSLISIDGLPAYKYIGTDQLLRQLRLLAERIDFTKFDHIVYNLNGGAFLKDLLMALEIKGRWKGCSPIEYHGPKGGDPANPVVVDRRIPEEMHDERVLCIEDVYDTGLSYQRMVEDCPGLSMIVVSHKIGVPKQVPIPPSVLAVFRTVNLWQGGAGMNLGFEGDKYYPVEAFRHLPGIVIRPPDDILDQYQLPIAPR